MRNTYLPYNPVFESLHQQASKYSTGSGFNIYEQSDPNLNAEEVQNHVDVILLGGEGLLVNVMKFCMQAPLRRISKQTVKLLSDKLDSLKDNKSLSDLVSKLFKIWEECYNIAASDSAKPRIMSYYDKVNEGMDKLKNSLKTLEDSSKNQWNTKELLDHVNGQIEKSIEAYRQQLVEIKKDIDSGAKEAEKK